MHLVHHGDCVDYITTLEDNSLDCIITDPPYGTTNCKWDSIIPFEAMWDQLKRVIKMNGAIVLLSSQPFTSSLVMSNPKLFKYEWIWEKDRPSNPLVANKRVMPRHENICIFYDL